MSAKTNAKKKEQDKRQSSGLGLDGLGDLAGLLNEQPAANAGGAGPQELPLDLIDEDPHQPRTADNPGFSPESIASDCDPWLMRSLVASAIRSQPTCAASRRRFGSSQIARRVPSRTCASTPP